MDSHPVLNNYRQAFQACQTRAAASLTGLTRHFNEEQTLIDELNRREKRINDREKELESSKTHLDSLKSLIKKHLKALDSVTESLKRKRDETDSTERRFTDSAAKLMSVEKSLDSKERRVKELKRSIEDEIKSKKEKLDLTQKFMKECSNTLDSRKIMVREIELRLRDFEKKLEAWCFKLESKERREENGGEDEEFDVVVKRVERYLERLDEHKRVCELREERVRELEAKVKAEMEEQQREAELSRNQLLFVTSLISKKSEELDVIEKSLKSVEKCVEEKLGSYGEEIEVKKRQLDEVLGLVEGHKRDLDLEEVEIRNKRRCIDECEREMELKRRELEATNKLVEEQAIEAEKKLLYFRKCVEQKRREFECKEMELKAVQEQIVVKGRELGEILKSIQEYTIEFELKGMHVKTLEETIKGREKSFDAISNKLNEREEQMQFDSPMETVELENEMNSVSLEIEERGMILAAFSQSLQELKDDSERPLEEQMMIVPSFVLDETNINADGTSSMNEQSITLEPVERIMSALLNADETLKLIGMISQNKKLTLQSFQRLGFEDKIPNIIWVLIEKNQVVEAARLICTFNLHGQFAPVQLLKSFVDEAMKCCFEVSDKVKSDNEQKKVVLSQMDDMIAAAQCVEDHDLESEYTSIDIRLEMREVAKLLDDKEGKSIRMKQGSSSVTPIPHTCLLRQRRIR